MPIMWLASFPKSGNTWLRAFLANYLTKARQPVPINRLGQYAYTDAHVWPYERLSGKSAAALTEQEIDTLRPRVHEMLASGGKHVALVKTHSMLGMVGGTPTITPAVTFGAIYVVRNPLDVVASYADHYGHSLEAAVEGMAADQAWIAANATLVRQHTSSWSGHVRSWLEAEGLHRHVVRYEDMTAKPEQTFAGILKFMRTPVDKDLLTRAIRFSSFRELARQEAGEPFIERSARGSRFFREGRAGGWREVLPPALVEAVVDRHRDVMARFHYLPDERADR